MITLHVLLILVLHIFPGPLKLAGGKRTKNNTHINSTKKHPWHLGWLSRKSKPFIWPYVFESSSSSGGASSRPTRLSTPNTDCLSSNPTELQRRNKDSENPCSPRGLDTFPRASQPQKSWESGSLEMRRRYVKTLQWPRDCWAHIWGQQNMSSGRHMACKFIILHLIAILMGKNHPFMPKWPIEITVEDWYD